MATINLKNSRSTNNGNLVKKSRRHPRKPFRIPRNVLIVLGLAFIGYKILSREQQGLFLLSSSSSSDQNVLRQEDFPKTQGIVVAYAVSITYCHPDDFIPDAAGVLAHSIHLQSSRVTDPTTGLPKSRYDYQMYAFVHPEARNCSASLEHLGYDVIVRETPIQVADIRNEELRHDVATQGCCQEKEFLKLYSLTLTEHPIVVHLDLDVILLQNLDELFDAMMLPDTIHYEYNYNNKKGVDNDQTEISSARQQEQRQKYPPILKNIPNAMWASKKTIPVTSYFTRDYNMAKQMHETPPNRVGMQGGFWIVQPNLQVFDDFREVILDGHNYTSAWGWGGPHLPKASYYGGAQIQGLVSYYYGFVRQGISVELNKCIYNNMVDRPRAACIEHGMTDTQCQDCRRTPIEQVKTVHLTLCKKPWWCPTWIDEPLCSQFHYEWHRIRADLEQQLDIATTNSGGLSTTTLQSLLNTSDMQQVLGAFPSHCSRMGSKGYKPISYPFLSNNNDREEGDQQPEPDAIDQGPQIPLENVNNPNSVSSMEVPSIQRADNSGGFGATASEAKNEHGWNTANGLELPSIQKADASGGFTASDQNGWNSANGVEVPSIQRADTSGGFTASAENGWNSANGVELPSIQRTDASSSFGAEAPIENGWNSANGVELPSIQRFDAGSSFEAPPTELKNENEWNSGAQPENTFGASQYANANDQNAWMTPGQAQQQSISNTDYNNGGAFPQQGQQQDSVPGFPVAQQNFDPPRPSNAQFQQGYANNNQWAPLQDQQRVGTTSSFTNANAWEAPSPPQMQINPLTTPTGDATTNSNAWLSPVNANNEQTTFRYGFNP